MNVSEVVTSNEVKSWNKGDIITIKAGTGKGKSYFIKNELYEIAKSNNSKVLMLIHRRNCIDQFQMEIEEVGKTDVIDIKTYQSIGSQNKDKNRINFDFSKYDYIVCDEMHYFFDDSWTKFTDISLNAILNENDKIRILMSATGDNMKKYLNKHKNLQTTDYEIPLDFNFIKHLEFYRNNDTLEYYIKSAIEQNRKAIFFINDTELAYKLHKKYKNHSLFNCSKSNNYYAFVNEEKIYDMLRNERFEETILITTSVFEAGVNIHDDELSIIVCDNIRDTGTLIQCIGRKRLKQDEQITVILKAYSNQSLGGEETKIRKKIEEANLFRVMGATEYTDKFYRIDNKNTSGIIYTESIGSDSHVELKLNELMFFKLVTQLQEIEAMKEYNTKDNYRAYMKNLLGAKDGIIIEDFVSKGTLEDYLESIAGEKLHKEDQKELIEKIHLKDARGRLQKGISLLNAYFEENGMGFLIVSKRSVIEENSIKKRISYWEIISEVDFNNKAKNME